MAEAGIDKVPETVLAVDTTSPRGSVALMRGGVIRALVGFDMEKTHSERLLPSVEFVTRMTGIELEEIDGFAVVSGPGSFTGIRIGIGSVQGLCQGLGRPAASATTLEVLAFSER